MSKYLEHLRRCQASDKMIHATPTVTRMIDRIDTLEQKLWEKYHQDACNNGASISGAVDWANERIEEI